MTPPGSPSVFNSSHRYSFWSSCEDQKLHVHPPSMAESQEAFLLHQDSEIREPALRLVFVSATGQSHTLCWWILNLHPHSRIGRQEERWLWSLRDKLFGPGTGYNAVTAACERLRQKDHQPEFILTYKVKTDLKGFFFFFTFLLKIVFNTIYFGCGAPYSNSFRILPTSLPTKSTFFLVLSY